MRRDVVQCGGTDGKARMLNCACPGRWTLISMPPGPKLVSGCCERWLVAEWKLVSDSRSSPLAYWPASVIQEIFFWSGMHLPEFKRFWHVLFEVGVSAFAPLGPLTASSGLARSHPAHVQGAANNWRTLGLSAFWPKTSDRYRVLCVIFPVCQKTKIGLPQLSVFCLPLTRANPCFGPVSSLILIRRSSWLFTTH